MTQEEKELLLKDLCARLPYHTKIDTGVQGISTLDSSWYEINRMNLEYDSDAFLPYLRPMSSMTEEEKNVFHKIVMKFNEYELFYYNIQNRNFYEYLFTYTSELLDWLHAHHFDYRGLIEKGLALKAPEDMYGN